MSPPQGASPDGAVRRLVSSVVSSAVDFVSSISASHFAGDGMDVASLQALLALGTLLVALLIDHAGEGVFELAGNGIRDSNDSSQEQTSRLAVPQRGREEAERRAVVHGRVGDVEWERGDWSVHQDAEVVAQVGTGDAERPHGSQDEDVTSQEERNGRVFDDGVQEQGRRRLVGEGFVVTGKQRVSVVGRQSVLPRLVGQENVQVVSEDTEREDGNGERIAAVASIAAKELGDDLVVVF